MKLLVDACAGQRLANRLRQAGHDVDFTGDWPKNGQREQWTGEGAGA
jgi:predicted nuclease of predicted toxin-antitoxin system